MDAKQRDEIWESLRRMAEQAMVEPWKMAQRYVDEWARMATGAARASSHPPGSPGLPGSPGSGAAKAASQGEAKATQAAQQAAPTAREGVDLGMSTFQSFFELNRRYGER